MKKVSFRNLMKLLIGGVSIISGAGAIITLRKLLTVNLPPGHTVDEYHQWLSTQAPIEGLRTLAVSGDDAVRSLCHLVLYLSLLLIGVGIYCAFVGGCAVGKKAAKEPT